MAGTPTNNQDADTIEASEALLRAGESAFVALSQSLFAIKGIDGYFKSVNGAWTRLLGWSPRELLARPAIGFVHPEDREQTERVAQSVHAGYPLGHFTNRYLHIDGSARRILWNASYRADAGVVYAVGTDITALDDVNDSRLILLDELDRRARQIASLTNFARAASIATSAERAMLLAAETVTHGLRTSHAAVYLETAGVLALSASVGFEAHDRGAPCEPHDDTSQVYRTLASRVPIAIGDRSLAGASRSALLDRAGIVASLSVPIVHERAIGVLTADDGNARTFDIDDIAFLEACAATLASALRAASERSERCRAPRHCDVDEHRDADQILAIARLGTWTERADTRTVALSARMQALLGYRDASHQSEAEALYSAIERADLPRFESVVQAAREGRYDECAAIVRARVANGEIHYLRISAERRTHADGLPEIFGTALDVTDAALADERLRDAIDRDAETGAYTRKRFEELLDEQLGVDVPIVVVALQLASLSALDNTIGNAASNALISSISRRLTAVVGDAAIVARASSDTLLFFAPTSDAHEPEAFAARICDEVLHAHDRRQSVAFAMGLSHAPADGSGSLTLIFNAKLAMQAARQNGPNTVRVYRPAMHAAVLVRAAMESDLRRALDDNEYFLLFQPIVSATEGEITAFEALVRWNHPEAGLIQPGEFIAVAEATGDIIELSKWVLHEATRRCRTWQRHARSPIQVTVNVSALHLAHPDFIEHVLSALRSASLPARYLELEVTETLVMHDVERAAQTLSALRSLGITTALDDFGTGYSSLSYLKKLPFDNLKIDRAFVRELAIDPSDRALADAIVTVAKKLGLHVIAEGVETIEQLRILRALGCDNIQGFLFSRPVEHEAVEQMLRTRQFSRASLDALLDTARLRAV